MFTAAVLLLLYGLCCAVDWAVVSKPTRHSDLLPYITKPLPLTVLTLYAALGAGSLFGALPLALLFSLAGDVLLMMHGHFLYGLVAFLLAQLLYLIQLGGIVMSAGELATLCALMAACFAPIGYYIYRNPARRRLFLAVSTYAASLALVLLSAASKLNLPCTAGGLASDLCWPHGRAVLVTLGAVLFCVSDVMLAVNRFVRPFARAQLYVRITYHLAQTCLVLGL